jgi:hypothetical protein
MAAKIVTATGTIYANQKLEVKSVLLTAAAADATLVITGNGTDLIKLNAKAGTSAQFTMPYGTWAGIEKPVTATITGASAWARIDV